MAVALTGRALRTAAFALLGVYVTGKLALLAWMAPQTAFVMDEYRTVHSSEHLRSDVHVLAGAVAL